MLKELSQLHTKDALLPIRKEDMPYKSERGAIFLCSLKEKHGGSIKARECADIGHEWNT